MPTKHKSSDIAVKFPVTDADWDALIAVAPDSVDDPDMRPIDWSNQDFRFPSFPRQRESSKPLKKLDTRFRGYDEFKGLGESPANATVTLGGGIEATLNALRRARGSQRSR